MLKKRACQSEPTQKKSGHISSTFFLFLNKKITKEKFPWSKIKVILSFSKKNEL